MKKKEKKKTAFNDWGTLIAEFKETADEFDVLPKSGKIFSIVAFLAFMGFCLYFINNLFPDISEADRMQNRIAALQEDIKSQTATLGMVQYSSGKSAKQAQQAIADGITNPLGPTEKNREDYQDGVKDIGSGDEMSEEIIAKIAEDQAEIKRIQQNLAAGVYKEK